MNILYYKAPKQPVRRSPAPQLLPIGPIGLRCYANALSTLPIGLRCYANAPMQPSLWAIEPYLWPMGRPAAERFRLETN